MEVARRGEVIAIEVGDGHVEHHAGIGEDAAGAAMGQEEGDAGFGSGGGLDGFCGVDAGLCQTVHGNATHFVVAIARDEADTAAEYGEVVGKDGGRTAEGHLEIRGEDLAVERDGGVETVEDEVEVDLSGDRDVKLGNAISGSGSDSVLLPFISVECHDGFASWA